jgi:hypothetical protein
VGAGLGCGGWQQVQQLGTSAVQDSNGLGVVLDAANSLARDRLLTAVAEWTTAAGLH